MGISSMAVLFGLGIVITIWLLVREVKLLNEALVQQKESNVRFRKRLHNKLAESEIEKAHLEDKIFQLEESVTLWQGKSRRLNRHVNFLTSGLDSDFEDDSTKEYQIK